jgi:hypothetical protein
LLLDTVLLNTRSEALITDDQPAWSGGSSYPTRDAEP